MTMSVKVGPFEQAIRQRFAEIGNPAVIPLQRRGVFSAKLVEEGVIVDNLGNLPLLPWAAFDEAVRVIVRNGGRALRGDAMRSRLGDPGLPFDSVEGHVAHSVYGKRSGDAVFRRISPLAAILLWAGICHSKPRELVMASVNYASVVSRNGMSR